MIDQELGDKFAIAFGVAVLIFACVGMVTCGAATTFERIHRVKSDNAREVMRTCLRHQPYEKCMALHAEMLR